MEPPQLAAASLVPSDDKATDIQFLEPDPDSAQAHAPSEYEAV